MFSSILNFHILGFEFASCLRQCTRKYFEENYEEFDYNHLDFYHYANLAILSRKILEIQKALEINVGVCHCLQWLSALHLL